MNAPACLPPPAHRTLPVMLEGVGYSVDGRRLIQDLNLVLSPGPRTVILGPNGAGKSLTLRLCHGLLKPTSGLIQWGTAGAPNALRQQAMVFQRPVLLRRSALSNVEYPLGLRRVPRRARRARAVEALHMVGLAWAAERSARHLSIGEQQRLALARAWVLRPQVLFLDEPTASLDPAATRSVEALINVFHEAGTKVVMTTHDLGQARRLADEVAFLNRGRLLEFTPADTFFSSPRTPEAGAFVQGELLW